MPQLLLKPEIEHFIRSRLYWFGPLARKELIRVFNISTTFASQMLGSVGQTLALKRWGQDLAIDEQAPAPKGVSSRRFLSDLYSAAVNREDPTVRCGGDVPSIVLDTFRGQASEGILRPVLQALAERMMLEIEYVGMNVGDVVKTRTVEPLRLVHVSGRWHLSARCQDAEGERDFVLTRILRATVVHRNAPLDVHDDLRLNAAREHAYTPHPLLSQQQAAVVADEFGMTNGQLVLALTDAERFYFDLQYVAQRDDERPPVKLLVRAT